VTETPTTLSPLRSRYLLAAALVLVSVGSVVMWGLLTAWSTEGLAAGLDRTEVPGELTVDLHPGEWMLYAEGDVTVDRVQVRDPDGREVPVEQDPGDGTPYEYRGRTAEAVASFELPRVGELPDMQIVVEGSGADPEATVAVAEADRFDHLSVQRWGMLALFVVNVGAAVLSVVVPLVRHRRASRSVPDAAS
jgi:hypothetical protein